MATSTRDSKKDHQTTRLFVLSLTVDGITKRIKYTKIIIGEGPK